MLSGSGCLLLHEYWVMCMCLLKRLGTLKCLVGASRARDAAVTGEFYLHGDIRIPDPGCQVIAMVFSLYSLYHFLAVRRGPLEFSAQAPVFSPLTGWDLRKMAKSDVWGTPNQTTLFKADL